MLIYVALTVSFGVFFALNHSKLSKIAGYSLIGYGSNLFLISCVSKKSPLMQSLVLTAIVIGIAIMVIIIGKK